MIFQKKKFNFNINFCYSKKLSAFFIEYSKGINIIYLPSLYFFINKTIEKKFIFLNKFFFYSFYKHLLFNYNLLINYFFVKIKIRGLGYK